MIDTEVESAMRSNSGKEKKTFKRKKGEGKRGKKPKGKKKNRLGVAHNFFFLKRKSFESARSATRRLGRPSLGPRCARGRGAPPLCQAASAAL